MDQLPSLGTSIWETIESTHAVYAPLLISNNLAIKSTLKESHQYGPHPRQHLDLYLPAAPPSAHPIPPAARQKILIFLYGGGLQFGEKSRPQYANGATFDNIGHYFASHHGMAVIIPDYRLLEHGARFPSGGEDLMGVVDWIKTELKSRDGFDITRGIDLSIVGNSAGGIHLCTYLFSPHFAASRAAVLSEERDRDGVCTPEVRLRAVVFLAVPFHFRDAVANRSDVLETYFGGVTGVAENCPLSLLVSAVGQPGGIGLPGVGFMQVDAPLDPEDEILKPGRDFRMAWPEQSIPLRKEVVVGHNHISPCLSLGTGVEKEEAWGKAVANFVDDACS